MKKSRLLAIACALVMGSSAFAQQAENQEITYVEDPAQGYLFNKFKDNWFITGEIGGNLYFSHGDSDRKLSDRFGPAFGLYAGKWFSPVIGLRAGVNFLTCKGVSDIWTDDCRLPALPDGKYKQKFNEFGPVFDVMLNLTNWWCGYHPGRKYNCVWYIGGGGYWTFVRNYNEIGGKISRSSWHTNNDRVITFRSGIINSWRVSKQVGLALDIRWNGIDNHKDEEGEAWNRTSHDISAYLTCTYYFKKREWNAPVVPVCPEPENCDALRARLEAAEGRIADLEDQLQKALNRPVQKEVEKAPLCTIYYPINIFKLTKKDVLLLTACADVMKDNPTQHYVLTGWADNYTGNDQINTRLRHNRVNGVQKQLVKLGVPENQLTATINAGNLCDLGEKYVALDRAVTIEEAK